MYPFYSTVEVPFLARSNADPPRLRDGGIRNTSGRQLGHADLRQQMFGSSNVEADRRYVSISVYKLIIE